MGYLDSWFNVHFIKGITLILVYSSLLKFVECCIVINLHGNGAASENLQGVNLVICVYTVIKVNTNSQQLVYQFIFV